MVATGQTADSDRRGAGTARAARAARAVQIAHAVGLGALVALALSVVRQSDTFVWTIDPGATAPLVRGFLLGAVAAALPGAVVSRARRDRVDGVGLAATLTCLLVAAASLVVVGVWPAALAAGRTLPSLLVGLVLGAGCALCLLRWTRALVRVEPRELVVGVAIATVVAGVALCAFRMARTVPAGVAWLLVVIALEVVALVVCAQADAGSRAVAADAAGWDPDARTGLRCLTAVSDTADRVERRAGLPIRVRDVLVVLWIPLVAVGFCTFVQGLTWDPVASMGDRRDVFAVDAVSMLVGPLAAAAVALASARRRDASASLALLNGVALPVALVVVLLVPVVTRACPMGAVMLLSAVASAGGFALLGLIAFVDLVVTLAVTRADRAATVACGIVALAALDLLGLEAIAVLGEAGRDLCLVLEAILLAAIAVTYAMRARGINAGVEAPARDGADAGVDVAGVAGGPTSATSAMQAAGQTGQASQAGQANRAGQGGPSVASSALRFAARSTRDGAGVAPGDGATETEDDFRSRCLQVACAYGLSPRETDVLQFLARGHSSRYIATELVISENTVRTHVRHIYEKTGVTSREGLFELVDAPAER